MPAGESEPLWWCDEMLGRLARYLRFLGYDVAYVPGMADREVLERARAQGRTLVTRDRVLARRERGSLLLSALDIEGQLRELYQLRPDLRREVRFVRCSLCNAVLVSADRSTPEPPKGVPPAVWAQDGPVYACPGCGQTYWEGSHTDEIRRTLARVAAPGSR